MNITVPVPVPSSQHQSLLRLPPYRTSHYRRFHPYARFSPPLCDILRNTPGPCLEDDPASPRVLSCAHEDDQAAAHLQDAISPQPDGEVKYTKSLQYLVIDLALLLSRKLKAVRDVAK